MRIRRSPHPAGTVDPARDLENLDLEFILADLAMVDRRLDRLASSGRHGTTAEREANEREEVILRRLKVDLEAGRPIRDSVLDADASKAIRGFRFLTEKPVLVLLNIGEKEIGSWLRKSMPNSSGSLPIFSSRTRSIGTPAAPCCCRRAKCR